MTTSIIRPNPITLQQLLLQGEQSLKASGLPNPRMEADLLVSHLLKESRLQLYLRLQDPVPAGVYRRASELFSRRAAHIPLQYLLSVQEFWGLEFEVTPDVLIPRPETELVVEEAIELMNAAPKRESLTIVDLGTGSGCIAIALAKSLPGTRVLATDISSEALAIARRNAIRLGADRQITFLVGDLFEPLKNPCRSPAFRAGREEMFGRADLIVSNPPYIPSGDLQTLAPEIKDHEPRVALDGGEDGLDLSRRIIQAAPDYLVPDGHLVLEMGGRQAGPIREWIHQQSASGGLPWEIRFKNDLAGIERVAILTKKS
ncbi:MAG TPA: peptide chain release factor N(5)-glutamine methyltransferase [Nitrospiria bacterium]|nr:peptide chain release factor N(5)-glutamine methyltransferase [Nitrospiria bacterium]